MYCTIGTPGGSTIPTSVIQTFLNLVIDKMTPAEAVAKPRFHHQWLPDEVKTEPTVFDEATKTKLTELGYHLKPIEKIGRVEVIWKDEEGNLVGGADSRGDDAVVGY